MNTRNLRLVPASQGPTPASSKAIGGDLFLALNDFSLVDQHLQTGNLENPPSSSSFLQSSGTPFPEINATLLESGLPDKPLLTPQKEVVVPTEMDHITVSFVTEVEKILANSQLHDIEMSMKEYAKALFLIHTTYDLGIMPKEKRLQLLLEIKTLLGHFSSDDDKARYIAFFDSKDFKKDLGIGEKEKLIKLARDTYRMYFQSKKKYEELLEFTKRQQQAEQQRLREEAEQQRLQALEADKRNRQKMLDDIQQLESTFFGQGFDFLPREESPTLSAQTLAEIAEHKEKIAQRRAQRLSQLSSQPLSKSDEK